MGTLSVSGVQLTRATVDDADLIAGLAEKIWQQHYPAIIGQEQVDYMLDLMYSRENIIREMNNGQRFHFIDSDGVRVGYVAWSFPVTNELFIHKFYIDTSAQGKGIGKRAFAELLEAHPEVTTIRLTVNRHNYKSINFYFRLGFVIEEVKDFDIGNGFFMKDFIMKYRRQ
jgi:diamine N-acetyltransferase